MKISCQSCAAKYTIADEKVVGKVIKIKCKKCSSTIVVNGNDPNVLAQLQSGGEYAGDASGFEDQAATQLLQQPPGHDFAANPDEWTVSISDDDQRTMTTAQILTEYAKGTLSTDTFVWKDGMGDWLPLMQVPELAGLLAASSAAPTPMAAPVAAMPSNNGYSQPPAAAAAAATAARKAGGGRGSSVDLFGGGGGELARPAETTAPLPQGVGSDKHVGERNETSVLFSLKDLAAAEAAAGPSNRPSAPKKGGAFDNSRNDRVDDILSLGSVSSAPLLAPPPMNAPIIEPPPPPPSVAPVSAGAMATPAYYAPPPAKKGPPIGIIVGGIGALALIGGIAFFVMAGGDKSAAKDNKTGSSESTKSDTKSSESTSKPADTSTAKPADTATATPTADTAAPTTDTATPSPSGDPKASTTAKVATNDPKTDPKTDPKADPKKEEPKEDPKKEEPKGGGDTPFDRGAASSALSGAAGGAKGCKKADGPTGSAKVQVTFAPSGKATQATVGPPFAGTPVGSCIAGAFRGLSVPPFSGAPVTVSKTVNIK